MLHANDAAAGFATHINFSAASTRSGSSGASSKVPLRKISVWHDATPAGDEPTLTDCGHLVETDDGALSIKLTQSQVADSAVPINPEGWQVLATSEDGSHYSGQIDDVRHSHASVGWMVKPDPVSLAQLNP
ncbi:hypothetical protein OSG_eHP31_00175 [environmental Halophage eHP-31]|nr:hypothetical protein OSG_eHP31_00175 [environmental Halophage eHP-31]